MEIGFRSIIRDIGLISLGVLSASYGLKSFLLPSGFIDGGVTGMSLLINQTTGFSFSILIVLINLPFIYLGYRRHGKWFGVKTAVAIVALAITVHLVDFHVATKDTLLVSIFGGFFLGAGIGLTMRGGGVIDGTEVLALYVGRKSGLTIGDFIMMVNVIIFSIAAFLLSYETALYSIVVYLIASKTVDYFVHGIEEYTGVTIVSEHSEKIRRSIIHEMGRGVTIMNGKRGFGTHGDKRADMDIVFTVVTRLEVAKLKSIIENIDGNAFVVMHSINDIKGGMVKKRALH